MTPRSFGDACKRKALRSVPDALYEQLRSLALRATPTVELAADALEIALAYDITAYDAAYVALSARLGLPLITADERLARALVKAPFDVRWLGAYLARCGPAPSAWFARFPRFLANPFNR